MKVYAIRYDFVVLAEDEEDAYEILYDVYGIDSEWLIGGATELDDYGDSKIKEVVSLADLPSGWTLDTPMFTRDEDVTDYTMGQHLGTKERAEDFVIVNGVKYVRAE